MLVFADFSARLAGLNVGGPARHLRSGDFGLIGLAVMGQNLIMNIADHGYTVVAHNRTIAKVDRFLENEAKGYFTHASISTLINLPVLNPANHREIYRRRMVD